ncbi:hypothetical protein Tsubulata_041828 [Turnera subulata]|uniref:Ionotropic glutamate receptor C-terminal domain-containing protein n=1 Tax=Turnera subulata TaxID=218843 RepID=A0A9Q0JH52_9ROSI|nr:hypothetical protein Tsubulata_041828 [Turnera subulata]
MHIRLMESRVIVLHTFSKTGLLVFDLAQRLEMMQDGFVWIATSWLSTLLDSITPLPPNIQGALTLRPHTPDSKKNADFVSRWQQLSNGSVGLNPSGLYAYDTVWMVARAVRRFLDQGNRITFSNDSKLMALGGSSKLNLGALSVFDGGSQLLNLILQTNMSWLTGPFSFNPDDRCLPRPAYDIINVIRTGQMQVGCWSNHSGLSVVPPETLYDKEPNRSFSSQYLSTVVWPGGSTVRPRGWDFPDNGRQLRIGIPNRVSYKHFVQKLNGSDVVQGYCIDVFCAAVNLLPYEVPYKFVPYGNGRRNPSYNKLVFDGVVGDIAIVTNRTKTVDFTQPYVEAGLVLVAPVKKLSWSAWASLRPFTPLMWAVTGAFFLIVEVVLWIPEYRINESSWGHAFPRDSPLAVDMSTAILKLSENGELEKIHNRWLTKKTCSSVNTAGSGAEQLNLQCFSGLFLVCGTTCFLALLVHFCKMLHQFMKYFPEDSSLFGSTQSGSGSRSKQIQTFLSFADEKAEV